MRELADYGIDINAVHTRNDGGTRNQNPLYEEEDDDRTVRERSYTPEDTIEQSSRPPSSSRPQSSQNASHPLALPRSNSQSNQHSHNNQQSGNHHQNNNNNNSYRDEPSSYRNNTQSSQRQNATGSVYSDGYTHDDDATVITYSDSDVDV